MNNDPYCLFIREKELEFLKANVSNEDFEKILKAQKILNLLKKFDLSLDYYQNLPPLKSLTKKFKRKILDSKFGFQNLFNEKIDRDYFLITNYNELSNFSLNNLNDYLDSLKQQEEKNDEELEDFSDFFTNLQYDEVYKDQKQKIIEKFKIIENIQKQGHEEDFSLSDFLNEEIKFLINFSEGDEIDNLKKVNVPIPAENYIFKTRGKSSFDLHEISELNFILNFFSVYLDVNPYDLNKVPTKY